MSSTSKSLMRTLSPREVTIKNQFESNVRVQYAKNCTDYYP